MIGWFLSTRIGRAIGGALAALAVALGIIAAARRDAAKDALQNAKEADRDEADDIRNRVERDLPSRLREYEGRGFRDRK